jgi:adenylate cyclase
LSQANNNLKYVTNLIREEVRRHFGTPLGGDEVEEKLEDRIKDILINAGGFSEARAESKQVTILLSDIRGFTTIAEAHSALTVVDILNRYFASMCEVVVRYGGTIDKFMGDSIMVLFGAPSTASDDVERAIACAVEMQLAMDDINRSNRNLDLPDLFTGIGINSGTVVAGPLGPDSHIEYTVIGDEVNLTSRIEAHSLRGQVLLSENTYQLAKDFVEVGRPNSVQVKGKQDAVMLYELLATNKPERLVVPRREERKGPRVEMNIPLVFQCVQGKKVLDERFHGEVLDMSYNGMMIRVSHALAPMSEIKLTLSLGLLDSKTSDAYAKVLRCEPLDNDHRCHLEFTSVDALGQEVIKNLVDQMVYQG